MRVRSRHGLGVALIVLLLFTLWVLNVSTVGRPEGCLEGCAQGEGRRDGFLRVMSLNVLHGFPEFERLTARLDLIADEILRQDVDLVCLQEVPWTPRLGNGARYLAARVGMNYLFLRANGQRRAILFEEGSAILSRYPLKGPAFTELRPRAGFFEHRIVLHAIAVTPWGDLRVFVTHLTHGEQAVNEGQAASLSAFVQATGSGPAVVAGDFNAREDSPQIEALARAWVDAYRVANPDDPGLTCCADDLTRGPDEPLEKRIDYIFLVPASGWGAEVLAARRVLERPMPTRDGWLWASDHVGLLATIRLGR